MSIFGRLFGITDDEREDRKVTDPDYDLPCDDCDEFDCECDYDYDDDDDY